MSIWLVFLLKSTFILSLLYLVFRLLIRNETLFLQSRIILVLIVLFSIVIPITYLPSSVPDIVSDNLDPIITTPINQDPVEKGSTITPGEIIEPVARHRASMSITGELVVLSIYSVGVFISFCLFLYRLISVLQLIKKSQRKEINGLRLNIINDDISAFTFGKFVVISKQDFETNSSEILTHELSHIKQGHFYDLMLMELVKIIYWFNPLIYMMNQDIKEIHEFQADEHTIKSGIDTIKYQLLIIQKSVGQHKFALANSFNHCQIKNRITMMNKSKNSKRWNWKVATFLPLLVLLLMAFGRKDENPPEIANFPIENPLEEIIPTAEIAPDQYEEFKQKIEIRKDGNYISNQSVTLEEIEDQDRKWREASNSPIFLLIDESLPLKRVDEVRQSLKGPYWVVQATVNSDDLVYFAGDVNKLAKLKQGVFSDWLRKQLEKYPETQSKKYRLSFSIIVDKNGKARDGHVIENSEYSEINDAYNEILSQIPDWEPAMRGNEKVSVYWKYLYGNNWEKNKTEN